MENRLCPFPSSPFPPFYHGVGVGVGVGGAGFIVMCGAESSGRLVAVPTATIIGTSPETTIAGKAKSI